jgi:hypothetical protein
VIGSALAVKYAYTKDGKPILIKEPKLMLNDNMPASRRAFTWKSVGVGIHKGRRRDEAVDDRSAAALFEAATWYFPSPYGVTLDPASVR